jgi:hypothetical protein
VLIRDSGGIWLVRRTAGEWHEGLWALPSVMHSNGGSGWMRDFNRRFSTRLTGSVAAHSARYQVTHHRIELRVFEATAAYGKSTPLQRWELGKLGELPIVTAHRKSLARLGVLGPT